MSEKREYLPAQLPLDDRIHTVRGFAVMLDSDLAAVYGVETKRVNEAVKRNTERFEYPYSFQLLQNEWDALRSQAATLKAGRGQHRKYLPRVFTEHGAVMLATVLNSERAIQASRTIVDAFVNLRRILGTNSALASRIDELIEKVDMHDNAIAIIFHDLQRLAAGESDPEPEEPKERIGFKTGKERGISGKTRKG